ncbi:MAG TPA: FtsX-like permease family protein, partial [Candidatus Limnocylindria bacterium]
IDTAMLRTRGADPWQLTLLSLGEALLLAVPAVLLGPWLAAAALLALNAAGPLADVGLTLDPRVTSQAYLASAAAGAVCVALMVVPVLVGARRFAESERDVSRAETRTFGQRMGLDVALLAVSAIALWQLRIYGAPLTKSVRGSLGLDPLLVAAPAIGLLAGGVLALRILPAVAQAAELAVARGKDLVTALGIQQLARRPLRYTRSALLLMIAVSTGVFALSYAATWSGSQRDQAAFQSGAAVRVMPDHTVGAMPSWALPAAYAAHVSADRMAPVEHLVDGLGFGAASGDILGIDADTAAAVVLFRADQSASSLGALMQALRSGRPAPKLPVLPDGTRFLRVQPRVELLRIQRLIFSFNAPEPRIEEVNPEHPGNVQVSINAVVRDARGLLYAIDSAQVRFEPGGDPITFELTAGAQGDGEAMVGPIQLARLSVEVWLPTDTVTTKGFVGLASISAASDASGPWTNVPLDDVGGWKASVTGFGRDEAVPADESNGVALPLTGGGIYGTLFGEGLSGPPTDVQLMPASLATLTDAVPVIANRAFLAATNAAPGDTVTARVEGMPRDVTVAGVVDQFPSTAPGRPVVVMDERTLGLVRLQSNGSVRDAGEWWFAPADGNPQQLADTLAAAPFKSGQVLTAAARARTLSRDPVAVGILGALTLGFVAAALFAVVGLVVSAVVSARQRRTEFAVLRALGLSGRQLSGWLWLENGSVVAISLLAGTGLGLLIGWLVLPFVTVTQQGTAPVPAAIVQVPWDRILVLEAVGAVALAAAVAVIGSVLRRLGVGATLRMGDD